MALKASPTKKGGSFNKKQDTNKDKAVKKKEETSPESTKQFKIMKRKSFPIPRNTDTTIVACTSFSSNTSKQIYSSANQFPPITYEFAPPLPLGKPFMPYYPPLISPPYAYPVPNNWSSPTWPCLNPMYSFPVPPLPIGVLNPILSSPRPMLAGQPLFADPFIPFAPALPINVHLFNNNYESVINYNTDQIVPYQDDSKGTVKCNNAIENVKETEDENKQKNIIDPLEYYLSLPKDLFPTARMLTVDSNLIINEFCKEADIQNHCHWILDLEFGVPNTPVTRPIAIYDVQFNSIHCKNTPGAIHPGFESCSQDFKKICQFYYDCIVSSWYTGYMVVNNDTSVANFQSWLQLPMEVFGMCWP